MPSSASSFQNLDPGNEGRLPDGRKVVYRDERDWPFIQRSLGRDGAPVQTDLLSSIFFRCQLNRIFVR
jgi:hypothetical protein